MRKWLVLLLLLVPVLHGLSQPQVEASSQLVLATGTADSNETKISNRPGTAFFDFGVDMTAWVGEMIEIKDAAGHVTAGIISTVGTGETLGSELCSGATPWAATTSPPDYYYDTFESSNATTITSAIADAAEVYPGSGCTALVTAYNGGCFKLSGTLDLNSGGAPYFGCGTNGTDCPRSTLANGATTGYTFVRYGVNASAGLGNDSGATDWSMTDISIKQLTAPSSTGHWIVAAPGSTTKNWAYFDPLFMSGPYTWRIISRNILGSEIAGGTVTAGDVHLVTDDGNASITITGLNFSDISSEGYVKGLVPVAWWKADDLADANGTAIGTWVDKMATYNMTQTSAGNKPKVIENCMSTRKCLLFDGSDDYMASASNILPSNAKASVFMVFNATSEAVVGSILSQYASEEVGRLLVASNQNDGGVASAGRLNFFVSGTTNGAGLAGILDDYAISGNTILSWVNSAGTEGSRLELNDEMKETATTAAIYAGISSKTALGSLVYNSSSVPYDGSIAEIVLFNRTLTNQEKMLINKSLAQYYGISLVGLNSIPTTFAGNDSGGTKTIIDPTSTSAATITTQPYLLTFYDSSGRQAKGFAGAAYNTTGVKLFSTRSGTTQNMAGSDSGFDKAAVTKWKAYRTY